MFAIDVTVDAKGRLRIIEVNGSNAALTSTATGNDMPRAMNMARAFLSRSPFAGPVAVALAHRPRLQLLPEFYARVLILLELLAEAGIEAELVRPGGAPSSAAVTVLVGDIPSVARCMTRRGRQLYFDDRPIELIQNPNLLPELVRSGLVERDGTSYDIDLSVFHEGPAATVIHDKVLQQHIAAGTGFTPLHAINAWSLPDAAHEIEGLHRRGIAAVAKMFSGSGGAGIGFFPVSDDPQPGLAELVESAQAVYGVDVQKTVFPIQVFEFVESTGFTADDGPHLWDLRLLTLTSPDRVEVLPCVIRICPAPYAGKLDERAVKNNLTGREPSDQFTYAATPENLARAGLSVHMVRALQEASANWAEAALAHTC
jgi:hypothetical protein